MLQDPRATVIEEASCVIKVTVDRKQQRNETNIEKKNIYKSIIRH